MGRKKGSGRKAGSKAKGGDPAPQRPGPRRRRHRIGSHRLAFLCVFGVAVLLRVAYSLASRQSPFFDHLDLDSRFYDLWAREISAGDWIGDDVFFMGPLYSYFLALIYKIAGPNLVVVKIVQSVLGGLTAGVAYLLGRECFGVVVGLIAGFLAALYVPFIFYDNSILFPVLATLLNTLMLYFFCRGVTRVDSKAFVIAGLCAGFSAAGNASVLVFGPFAVGFLLLYGSGRFGIRLKKASLFVIGVAVVVGPITVRNLAVGKDFVPLTSNAGINLYIGNNEKSTGAYVKPEGLDIYTDPSGKTIAETAVGRELKPSEVSAYWAGRALDHIKSRPGQSASNLVRKMFLFWSVYEIPQIEHLPFEKRYSRLLRIPSPTYGVVCPLAVLGMILALRRRKEAWLLFLFAMSYAFTIVAFFVVARYRLPMVPVLMVFAGYAVAWCVSRWARREYGPLVYSIGGFVALYILVHVNFYMIDPMSGFAQSYYRLGVIHEKKNNMTEAMEDYRKALDLDPELTAAHLNAGILLSRIGRYGEAKTELLRTVELDPGYAKAYYNLGLVYAEEAVNDSALMMMERATELKGDYGLARLGKASIYYETARFDEAESLLKALRDDSSFTQQARGQIDALLNLLPPRRIWMRERRSAEERASDGYLLRGDNLLAVGLADRALEAYTRAVRIDGGSTVALYQAGTVYFNSGRLDEAERYFDTAIAIDPAMPDLHFARGVIAFRRGNIGAACEEFNAELEIEPRSGKAHINLAMCYEQHLGDLGRAAYHLSQYIELTGGTGQIREHLKELKERLSNDGE
ncbi:MAG: tetratricopeptide repeat protein [Candidatus Eisenbacteria bacterium]